MFKIQGWGTDLKYMSEAKFFHYSTGLKYMGDSNSFFHYLTGVIKSWKGLNAESRKDSP